MNSLSLVINCGYANVAVFELSRVKLGKSRLSISRVERVEKFQIFLNIVVLLTLKIQCNFWGKELPSRFNRFCDYVLDCFRKQMISSTKIDLFIWRPLSLKIGKSLVSII